MRTIAVGIGCRLGVSVAQIEAAVHAALGAFSLDDVRVIASIESKAGEAALLDFCALHGMPLRLFTAAQIAGVETSASAHVQKHLEVGGVCEPCALLASHDGRLVVPKMIADGVTVAIAADSITSPSSKSYA